LSDNFANFIGQCWWPAVTSCLQNFFKVTPNLRGYPPDKKIHIHTVFKETPTNYISIARLWNVEFDKIIFFFADCFPKVAEAVNTKTTDWSDLVCWNAIVDGK